MRVSVVIPTYNSAPYAVEAVKSVLAQTRPADEVLVVDDGSTDDTAERIARFADRVTYIRQVNARVAAARNTGIRAATGDVVAFLDADDVWHPRKLEYQLAVLEGEPDVGLIGTGSFPSPGELSVIANGGTAVRLRHDDLLPSNPLTTSSVLTRRSVLDQVGWFDTQLFGPEDYDLWLRCARVAEIAMLDRPLTGYRDTPGSVSKQADSMRSGLARIHTKLAVAGVWTGRPWFRRKCAAHADFDAAYLHRLCGRPWTASKYLLRSLWTFPAPMGPPDVKSRWSRARLLTRLAAILCTGRDGSNPKPDRRRHNRAG